MGRRSSTTTADGIARALQEACGPRALIPEGAAVLVACSGGADSTALAAALCELVRAEPALKLRVAIGHVDHGLRSESKDEAASVRALADSLGAPFFLETLDADSLHNAMARDGLEAAARNFRYAALERLATRAQCTFIATGHTRRDQAETVLLRLSRGGGLGALAGVRASRALGKLRLVRPLLEVSRAATEAFCEARVLSYSSDPHNRDPRRSRARLREAFDQLSALLNPRLEEGLAASARIAAEEDALLDSLAREALVSALEIPSVQLGNAPEPTQPLRLEVLTRLPDALLRRVLLLAANAAGARPEREHLQRLCEQVRRGKGALDLPGARALLKNGMLHFQIGNGKVKPLEVPGPLAIPGPGLYVWGALRLDIVPAGAPVSSQGAPLETGGTPASAIDVAKAPFPWVLRAQQPGDRFRPSQGKTKKVGELWIDAKVPREQRAALPLLADATGALFFVAHLRPRDPPPRDLVTPGLSVSLRFFRCAEGASFDANPSFVEQRGAIARATIRESFDEEPR